MRFWSTASVVAVAALSCATGDAWARRTGIAAAGCDGCHGGGQIPTVGLSIAPAVPAAGQPIIVTVSVSQTNGPVAGFYLTTAEPVGTFQAIEAGTGLNIGGVTHTMPRTGAGGVTTFRAQWSASTATGVVFNAYAVSANNNGAPTGDGAGTATLAVAVGCGAGITLYLDQDGDGYGTSDPAFPPRKDCAARDGYATVAGDCDDFNPRVHPGAPEQCDGVDNNCDGHVDENVVTQMYCQDRDGDGHGVPGGATKLDCAPSAGFGDCAGDCNDNNAAIYPGAVEICDGRDNDCNGLIDEGVRPACGVGWCRRIAPGCASVCTPGPPRAETCNLFDDDCDGVIDNGTDAELCGQPGMVCVQGQCVAGTSGPGGSGGGGGAGSGGSSSDVADGGGARGAGAGGGHTTSGCSVGANAAANSAGTDGAWPAGWALIALALGATAIARRRRLRRRPAAPCRQLRTW